MWPSPHGAYGQSPQALLAAWGTASCRLPPSSLPLLTSKVGHTALLTGPRATSVAVWALLYFTAIATGHPVWSPRQPTNEHQEPARVLPQMGPGPDPHSYAVGCGWRGRASARWSSRCLEPLGARCSIPPHFVFSGSHDVTFSSLPCQAALTPGALRTASSAKTNLKTLGFRGDSWSARWSDESQSQCGRRLHTSASQGPTARRLGDNELSAAVPPPCAFGYVEGAFCRVHLFGARS